MLRLGIQLLRFLENALIHFGYKQIKYLPVHTHYGLPWWLRQPPAYNT